MIKKERKHTHTLLLLNEGIIAPSTYLGALLAHPIPSDSYLTSFITLWNRYSFSASETLYTKSTLPLLEGVARRVSIELRHRAASVDLCVWMTLDTVGKRVEKRRTSQD